MREDSMSEKAVLLTKQGKRPKQIALMLGTSANSIRVLLWKRRHLTDRELAGVRDA